MSKIVLSVAAALVLPLGFAQGAGGQPDKLQIPAVLDLAYGDALFQVLQGEGFEGLTRLSVAADRGLAATHRAEAELLLGGLYLEMGLHEEASLRLGKLLTEDVPPGVRNRAWFHLAKAWYALGDDVRAEDAVRRLEGLLPAELESERLHILANVLMRQGRFAEAADQLDGWQGPQDWAAYARVNLGVALIRDNQLDVAARYLGAVGQMSTADPELLALRDRANVTLAFAYLQSGEPASAKPPLARVRLDGPYSNRALLGAGWAEAALGDHRAALTPWLELKGRNLADPAVQESLLAIPFAYAQLGAPAQAAEQYEAGLLSLAAERQRIDAVIGRIRDGAWLDSILALTVEDGGRGWAWQLERLPPSAESRYLYVLLAGHEFQEGLKNYRDLVYLERRLQRWPGDIDAFTDLIRTREAQLASQLAQADGLLARNPAAGLASRGAEVSARLDAAAASGDVVAVVPVAGQAQWERISSLEQQLAAAAPGDATAAAQRERLRLLKGALYWNASAAQPAALQARRDELAAANAAVVEAGDRIQRLGAVRVAASSAGAPAVDLEAARARHAALAERMTAARDLERRHLVSIALQDMEDQRARLDSYQRQLRFALAALYDRASTPRGERP
jgi:hypothetical protein